MIVVNSPSGIEIEAAKDSIRLIVRKDPTIQNFSGINIYYSTDPGGGVTDYTKLNPSVINSVSFQRERKELDSEEVFQIGSTRTTTTSENIVLDEYFEYIHTALVAGTTYYYVFTNVAYDYDELQEVESKYSDEISATPITLTTQVVNLPIRTKSDVATAYINKLLSIYPELDLKPGTVSRDLLIDPPSQEIEYLYVILDFFSRSQSLITLLQFDDSNGDGVSDTLSESNLKQRLKIALKAKDDATVQSIINSSFDKIAGNFGIIRQSAEKAIGEIIFYTRDKFTTRDMIVPAGTIVATQADLSTGQQAITFITLSTVTIPKANASSFYNVQEERYEIRARIEAMKAGSAGNAAAGKIIVLSSPITGFTVNVINEEPTAFGVDVESNSSLAERSVLAFVGVDVGTIGGYLKNTLAVPDVYRAKIVDAGNPYMHRDWDDLRHLHIGGSVDVYIQGEEIGEQTDRFVFQYERITNEVVTIVDNITMRVESVNTDVTSSLPIYLVEEIENVTKVAFYNLLNLVIEADGKTLDIDETIPANATIGMDPGDVIRITYKWRSPLNYEFKIQPVRRISSINGEVSGDLAAVSTLYKVEDPLLLGNSTKASDYVRIIFNGSVPDGSTQITTNEEHTLVEQRWIELAKLGIDSTTIVVKNEAETTTYVDATDYQIIAGSADEYTQIRRLASGSIINGQRVKISYISGENIVIKYEVNNLLQKVQANVNEKRHATADVVVKDTLKTSVNIECSIELTSISNQSQADSQIRTNVANFLNQRKIGQNVYQSDIIGIIENIDSVIRVVVPLTQMSRADSTQVIRELIDNSLASWTPFESSVVQSYKTSASTLLHPTIDSGGYQYEHKKIFINDELLILVASENDVDNAAGSGYINADGSVVVSIPAAWTGTDINDLVIHVSYVVYSETGTHDILVSDLEYVELGDFNITFIE